MTQSSPEAVLPDRDERLRRLLDERFEPAFLRVVNDSARHAGHAGARTAGASAGQTHYEVLLVSPLFRGVNRVQRQRLVHEAVATEFESGLHALSLTLRTPEEQAARP
jgi:stress-induced morphogen